MEIETKTIIAKVREMYKNDSRLNHLLKMCAFVDMKETESGKIELRSIRFLYYDVLIVTNKRIIFNPEMRCEETLIEYNGFEELLSL